MVVTVCGLSGQASFLGLWWAGESVALFLLPPDQRRLVSLAGTSESVKSFYLVIEVTGINLTMFLYFLINVSTVL